MQSFTRVRVSPPHPVLSLYSSNYESDYSHIYGRLPLPYGRFRQYPSPSHPSSRQMYVSEWE